MNETKFKTSPLWEYSKPLSLAPNESQTIALPTDIETAVQAFYFTQNIIKNGASVYQYNVKASINVKISYKNKGLKNENFAVFFNRDLEEMGSSFENTAILQLQGNDVESITLTITNTHTTEPLTINNMALYESDDVKITTIAKVLKEETIAADLIQATNVFTDALFTQILQTNARSRSARLARPGQVVDYIQAEGNELGFYSAELGSEQEQFKIITTTAEQETEYLYWYNIIEGEDAYKYLTTIDPRERYPKISDSDCDKFRFMVLKPKTISKKMSIEFALDENGNLTPSIILGAGTDASGTTQNGKGFIYKNSNGFYHIYQQADGGKVGIVMDEAGVHIVGWADQHCESITFKDNGVKVKFVGEPTHSFEYVYDESKTLTGIIQDQLYLTSISYEPGTL